MVIDGGVLHPDSFKHSRTSTSFGHLALCLSCMPVVLLQGVHGVQLSPQLASAGQQNTNRLYVDRLTKQFTFQFLGFRVSKVRGH